MFRVPDSDRLIGSYNVLEDPDIEKWGVRELLLHVWAGGTIELFDVKVPLQEMIRKFGDGSVCMETVFQDIFCFPVYGDAGRLLYICQLYVNSKLYRGREEIVRGKEYIDTHWKEKFDLNGAAAAANLSPDYFAGLFKKTVGRTPYAYYQELKIARLKERLCDENSSVAAAFAACGVDYNGNYAGLFKKKVGLSPSAFKARANQGKTR